MKGIHPPLGLFAFPTDRRRKRASKKRNEEEEEKEGLPSFFCKFVIIRSPEKREEEGPLLQEKPGRRGKEGKGKKESIPPSLPYPPKNRRRKRRVLTQDRLAHLLPSLAAGGGGGGGGGAWLKEGTASSSSSSSSSSNATLFPLSSLSFPSPREKKGEFGGQTDQPTDSLIFPLLRLLFPPTLSFQLFSPILSW